MNIFGSLILSEVITIHQVLISLSKDYFNIKDTLNADKVNHKF